MYEASSQVSRQAFPEWPTSPQTSHVMCESMAWTVLFMASFSVARSSSLLSIGLFLRQACPPPSWNACLFIACAPPPALISHNFLDERLSSINGQGEECSSSSDIYVPLRHGREPLVEVLEHELVSILWLLTVVNNQFQPSIKHV